MLICVLFFAAMTLLCLYAAYLSFQETRRQYRNHPWVYPIFGAIMSLLLLGTGATLGWLTWLSICCL